MVRRVLAVLPLLLATSPLLAQTVTPKDLKRHIEVLASDAFEGRAPGTEGENQTINYIATQLQKAGLEPAAGAGGWYQPVEILHRATEGHGVQWISEGQPIAFHQDNIVLLGREAEQRIADAPLWFVGHGYVDRDKDIDQLAGADLKGAVALILYDAPEVADFPSFAQRVAAVTAAGAEAVVAIVGEDTPWSAVTSGYKKGQNRLAIDTMPALLGAMPLAAASRVIDRGGDSLDTLMNRDSGPAFRAVRLKPRMSADVRTTITRIASHNVVGRIKGSRDTGESLLLLAHWDHLGICRLESAKDRICNGAVDNASGIAMIVEAAKRLAGKQRAPRDILVLATTAEEIGLLGAEYFAKQPTVPLKSIVGAINIDTVAIMPAGAPVAIMGRGTTQMDPIIVEVARTLGRTIDQDDDANALITRQDGWALTRAGVPTVMIGGSFSDLNVLGAFLSGPYHKPDDDLARPLVLEGAAEDTTLLAEVARRLADPAIYAPGKPVGQ